ncbi:GDSL-type esterase/lipase family protein [Mariniflexile gromovii]|uniref:Prolyl oligopeptidase family serine peptidase n=1 Tax=Mariniflexile gromovii TaxID=362523 RepID=A0ABS4BUV1_9FLAO|nr:SGNH/GDSL hydrolase family protein [Mariniflexile gromovii]MBP0903850.1 prolyl oligopeptidase family serine peptidase [Mariniflexile gromovii]
MKNKGQFLVLFIALFTFSVGISQNKFDETFKTTWKSFEHINFKFEGKEASLTLPKKPSPGNPWVWRARFPDYHAEIDSTLLAKGFHIAYINTNNQFGSPKAVTVWNDFYKYLTTTYKLQAKVALHGHSRGGLFIYNWAKENAEKVACIYADAVVCDFKSWPAGYGISEGSKKDWEVLKAEYGFKNDEEAKAYKNNPIDNLDVLAKARVPILHTVSLKDGVVPPEENSLKLINNYIRLGGTATVSACSSGIQRSNGHHYEIDDPDMVVDFIIHHSTKNGPLNSSNYHQMRSGLQNSQIQFQRHKKGRVAFLGGSITYNRGWRDSVCNYLKNKFPETEFEFIAAGIPSMGTTPGAFRLERDVLSKGKIDLLFEEAAVNDATNGNTATQQIRGMEGIVRHSRKANPLVDIVMMHFVDPDIMQDYRAGKEPEVIKNHNKVAEHYSIPTINLAQEVTERIDHGEFTWKDDFKNLHPSPFGQGIYAHSMIQFLDNAFIGQLDNDDKLTAHNLPIPLDEFSYENGILLDVKDIKLKKGWKIDPSWNPHDGKGTRANYVNVPMLISETPGRTINLTFEGNTVGIAVAAGQDAGIIEYRLDKGVWQKQNLFLKWSKSLHIPWYFTLASGLNNKKHQLEIRITDEKDPQSLGHACRIRYVYINQ